MNIFRISITFIYILYVLLPISDTHASIKPDSNTLTATETATGYHYPWPNGWKANYTQKSTANGHINQFDFTLHRGIWGNFKGEEPEDKVGFIAAAKSGCIVYAKDSSDYGSTTLSDNQYANAIIIRSGDNEYAWYFHLTQNSIPDDLKNDAGVIRDSVGPYNYNNCLKKVEAGQIIGKEGYTGYSKSCKLGWNGDYSSCIGGDINLTRATHLHFMVSNAVPDLSKFPFTTTDKVPWPPKGTIIPVSFSEEDNPDPDDCISGATVDLCTSKNEIDRTDSVVLYFDQNFNGPPVKYHLENLNQPFEGDVPSWFNDAASSIRVSNGYSISLHRHNINDANQWGDDKIQQYSCKTDIENFEGLTYASGGSLQDSVSRVVIERCTGSQLQLGLSSITGLNDLCNQTPTIIPPKLTEPTDGALFVNPDRKVFFKWNATPNTQDYQIRVKSIPDMTSGGIQFYDIVTGSTSLEITLPADSSQFYWSVRARDKNQFWSEWSQWNDDHIPHFQFSTLPSVTNWQAKYFDNHNCAGPGCSTTPRCQENLSALDKNWGAGAPCGMIGDNWGALFTSNFYFSEGDYVFHVNHNDGARLFLDGRNILDVPNNAEDNNACPTQHLVGNHKLEVVYFENTGDANIKVDWSNDTSRCATTQRDQTPPTGKIIAPAPLAPNDTIAFLSGPQGSITVQANDSESGVNRVEFRYSSYGYGQKFATVSSPDNNGLYSAQWTDSESVGDGQYYTFEVYIYDNAGNYTTDYVDAILDANGPSLSPNFPIPGASAASPNYLTQSSIPIQIDATDHWSGVAKIIVQAKYSGSTTWIDIGQDTDLADGWKVLWQAPESANNNPAAFRVIGYDRVNNLNQALIDNIFIDWSPPSSIVESIGTTNSNQSAFPVSWHGTDIGSGIHQYRIDVSDNGGAWTNFYQGSDRSKVFTGQNMHSYVFRSQAQDNAGNWEPVHTGPDTQVQVILDNEPPAGSVIINNGDIYTKSLDVTLGLSATDNIGVVLSEFASFNQITGLWDWAGPEAYKTSRGYTFQPGEGWKTAWARFYDAASNISEWANDSIILDSLAPAIQVYSPKESRSTSFDVFWLGADDYYGSHNVGQEYFYHDVPGNAVDVFAAGNYAYVAAKDYGLRIMDVTNPYLPGEIGFIEFNQVLA